MTDRPLDASAPQRFIRHKQTSTSAGLLVGLTGRRGGVCSDEHARQAKNANSTGPYTSAVHARQAIQTNHESFDRAGFKEEKEKKRDGQERAVSAALVAVGCSRGIHVVCRRAHEHTSILALE